MGQFKMKKVPRNEKIDKYIQMLYNNKSLKKQNEN